MRVFSDYDGPKFITPKGQSPRIITQSLVDYDAKPEEKAPPVFIVEGATRVDALASYGAGVLRADGDRQLEGAGEAGRRDQSEQAPGPTGAI